MATEVQSVPESKVRMAAPTVPAPLQWLLFFWISGVIYFAFFVVPPAEGLGPLTPILYFHVPMAWNGGIGLFLAAIYSGIYLKTRRLGWDTKACAAAELGLLYCVLATVTGSMWARGAWNSWWNWDPKQSSMIVLILIYGAYFALRSATDDRASQAKLGSAYAILAVLTVPILMLMLPYYMSKMGMSEHPTSAVDRQMDARMGWLLLASTIGFQGLFLWMFRLRVAIGNALDRREDLI